MHPLLPIYFLMSIFALFGVGMKDSSQRAMVWLSGWGTMLVVMLSVAFRPIEGDTWRYYVTFARLSEMRFPEIFSDGDGNLGFTSLNWLLGQLGSHPLMLLVPITLFCVLMLRHSLRQLFSPTLTAIAILLYSVYPFFVFYVGSGIKQAIAMAMLLQAYICFFQGQRRAWLWIAAAPLFHSAALLAYPFLFVHLLLWRPSFGYRRALILSLAFYSLCIILAITELNKTLVEPLQAYVGSGRYEIYFFDAEDFNYRNGFRADFTIFSMIPLAAALWLRRTGQGISAGVSGWWLNLYILLASIYQLFTFAPFADRFASFGWYLVPMIVLLMLTEVGRKRPLQIVLIGFVFINLLMLQFYTGKSLALPF